MAFSPLPTLGVKPAHNAEPGKHKALAMLNKKPPAASSSPTPDPSGSEAMPEDFADQMNQQERNKYVKGKKLGEGTYAIVYKGHLRDNPKEFVAIKKIKVNADYKDGLAMDAIREVKCLQELSHPNIIALKTIYSSKDQNINIVLEYIALGDLEMLIKDHSGIIYTQADIKAWMAMIGRAVWFCHENFILHRDIKPNNLLIAADGNIKLADFGLARSFAEPTAKMTHNVITSWYRPPELFFEAKHYSGAVDVWSIGCVLAELIMRAPYIHGETDLACLSAINNIIGTPTEENWPGVSMLPRFVKLSPEIPLFPKSEITRRFPALGSTGVDLLMAMLSLDPRKRPTAKGLLEHNYFKIAPRPTKNEDLPKKGGGEEQMGEDLKRKAGELPTGRGDKVARKIDFGAMK
ncbi:hypothetical protein EG328_005535 [Venturia inaequalis]|uniref:Protein kinase domain-containing protein n=1 Tax=Venturia inaequalis TaxID=5025 RepID=A0A8H3VTD7_VENIN|nr:hypothetical protein EG328_005535 [Venturia inaequalis]KAE9994670.1 hypothetical protein EG327_005116 [Venturia inaequalis]